jgi:REP-associated tyrosine transposase
MARLPRYFVPDQPQHIIQRGNNREAIFAYEKDYQFYLTCLQEAAEKHGMAIHAYVLMTNHVHLLATPETAYSIPKTLQSVGRRYVQYFNYSYKRTGTLWEGRYKATLIDSTQYLLICSRYIELNPVRAEGMTDHPRYYPWSSYLHNGQGKEDVLITKHRVYRRLGRNAGERQAAYRALFRGHLSKEELTNIREATNKGWALGSERFQEKVAQLTSRRVKPLPRGRPRKEE